MRTPTLDTTLEKKKKKKLMERRRRVYVQYTGEGEGEEEEYIGAIVSIYCIVYSSIVMEDEKREREKGENAICQRLLLLLRVLSLSLSLSFPSLHSILYTSLYTHPVCVCQEVKPKKGETTTGWRASYILRLGSCNSNDRFCFHSSPAGISYYRD